MFSIDYFNTEYVGKNCYKSYSACGGRGGYVFIQQYWFSSDLRYTTLLYIDNAYVFSDCSLYSNERNIQ